MIILKLTRLTKQQTYYHNDYVWDENINLLITIPTRLLRDDIPLHTVGDTLNITFYGNTAYWYSIPLRGLKIKMAAKFKSHVGGQ